MLGLRDVMMKAAVICQVFSTRSNKIVSFIGVCSSGMHFYANQEETSDFSGVTLPLDQ